MEFLRNFLHRPRRTVLRRLSFHVHLWIGIILALYLIMIGFTGALLVFRTELESFAHVKPQPSAQPADIVEVVENLRVAYPGAQIVSVMAPTETTPTYNARIQGSGRNRRETTVAVDAATGRVLGEPPRNNSWLRHVQRLHATLWLGPVGRRINGFAAVLLLLLNLTGLVIWWPGMKHWTGALLVDFRRRWRRVNFDLHRAAGFWTLAIVSLWAISGIYFGWPSQVFALVNWLSPVVSARPPRISVDPAHNAPEADLHAIIGQAESLDPRTTLKGIAFPAGRRSPLRIFMLRSHGVGDEYTDTLYFDPYTGDHLATWRYGINQSAGDWFIWSEIPLHFGTYWGLPVKITWALLGLAIPLLTVTGAILYWNRVLSKLLHPR
jgi:uncharacterized iron-regulated membrane protein